MEREPCPWRILGDTGGAFAMGAIGGSCLHFGKTMYQAPKGTKFYSSMTAVKAKAPVIGGGFALWCASFSTFDCGLLAIRKKDDVINPIAAGAITGGLLSLRDGPKVAGRAALAGGLILAVIEGVAHLMTSMAQGTDPMEPPINDQGPLNPSYQPQESSSNYQNYNPAQTQ